MKKFTFLSFLFLFFGLIAAPSAKAQSYASRVISVCPHCKKNVYAYYKPVSYNGILRYTWVPAYHTTCQSRARSFSTRSYSPIKTYTKYHRGKAYNYIVPNRSYGTSVVRPGITITSRRKY